MQNNSDASSDPCGDIVNSMYLFLDGEQLSTEERSRIRGHLNECIPCLESFEFEAEFKQIVKSKCTDEVPTHVYEKVRAKLLVEIETTSPPSEE